LLFWLLDLVEGDGVAERFELALEPAGAMLDGVVVPEFEPASVAPERSPFVQL
jgi:hypothetical protein